MSNYGQNYSSQPARPIGFEGINERPPPYQEAAYGSQYSGHTQGNNFPVSAAYPTYPAGVSQYPGQSQGYSGAAYPANPPVAPIQGAYVPPAPVDQYACYQSQTSPSVYSNYTPSPQFGAQSSSYAPPGGYDGNSYDEQRSVGYDQQGGGNKKSGGGFLNNVGGFASKNKMQIAGAALSYKMGGGLGKVIAAGTAANLAHKYSKDQKYQQSNSGENYGGASPSSHGGSKGQGLVGNLMGTGQQLFGKAEKYVGGVVGGGGSSKKLNSGCVVQLISEVTGKALQILKGRDGSLVLDALGMESPQAFNAHFTVIRDSDKIMLHNNNNFMAIIGGYLTVLLGGPPSHQCKFRVHESQNRIISLESAAEPGNCVGIAPNGDPTQPSMTRHNDRAALFGLRTVYDPHGR